MNQWDRFRPYTPKKPPPAHGIRVKKAGTTWWGEHWLEALEQVLRGDAGRLARGRTYARAGRTHDLVVEDGKVKARVTGSRAAPYDVTIELPPLDDASWRDAIRAMANRAQFAAELLGGRMPREIDEVFRALGTSLFPNERADLRTSCSCPDWGDPCKHVAATHYVLGEALDRDPFLLFELRGRSKEQVLDGLRAARTGREPGLEHLEDAARQEPDIPKTTLGNVNSSNYDRPREPLPLLHFSFDEPATHGATLRQLGEPTTWRGARPPADLLAPLVRAAAEKARGIALAETDAPVDPAGTGPELKAARAARAGRKSTTLKKEARTRKRARRPRTRS